MSARIVLALLFASSGVACLDYPEPKAAKWEALPNGARKRIGSAEPDCLARGAVEFASWVDERAGIRFAPTPNPDVGVAVGAEATLPVANHENFRVGPWVQFGSDTINLVHGSGGITFLFGDLADPFFLPTLSATHDEGSLGLTLGTSWRGVALTDHVSDGPSVSARISYGSRRYMETDEGGNAYDVCDGSAHGKDGVRQVWVGHYGARYAYGLRVFVEGERSVEGTATELVFGVEIDPLAVLMAQRESQMRGVWNTRGRAPTETAW